MQTWHHVLRKSHSASMKSNTCEDEARFTVQVGLNANSHGPAGGRVHGTAPAPPMTSRRKAGADVPVGDNERRRRLATEQVASMKHQSTRAVFDYWKVGIPFTHVGTTDS